MKLKKILAAALAVLMCLSLLPAGVLADEEAIVAQEALSELEEPAAEAEEAPAGEADDGGVTPEEEPASEEPPAEDAPAEEDTPAEEEEPPASPERGGIAGEAGDGGATPEEEPAEELPQSADADSSLEEGAIEEDAPAEEEEPPASPERGGVAGEAGDGGVTPEEEPFEEFPQSADADSSLEEGAIEEDAPAEEEEPPASPERGGVAGEAGDGGVTPADEEPSGEETAPSADEDSAPQEDAKKDTEPKAEEEIIAEEASEETSEDFSTEAALATSGTCGDNLTWALSNGVLTISGTGAMANYSYGNAPWYESRADIVKVVLKKGVTTVGNYAFYNCDALAEITLPAGVTGIGMSAFYRCAALKKISFPAGLTSIGNFAFYGCTGLEALPLPESVTSIGNYAFYNCYSLKEVRFPAGLTSLGGSAFSYCSGLAEAYFAGDAPTGLTSAGLTPATLYYPEKYSGWADVLDTLAGKGVTCVGYTDPADIKPFAISGEASMKTGETQTLSIGGHHILGLTWTSSDADVVAVYSDGGAAAGKTGKAVITAATDDGKYSATLTITVTAPVTPGASFSRFASAMSNTLSRNNYLTYASPEYAHLFENADGSLTRVEYIADTGVVVEDWTRDGAFVSGRTFEMELPLFGGAFAGSSYNFLVFGQPNREDSDEVEVMRVVKYSKSWERLDSLSVYGANTYSPFEAGSLRMTEAAGLLYIHTCHEMYAMDGVHHQANMTFMIQQSDMSLQDSWTQVANIGYGYVSHSFNQFITTDGTYIYRADHGDAHPRGIAVTRCVVGGAVIGVSYTVALTIPGTSGANATGVSVGGFEAGANRLLIAGNAVDISGSGSYSASGRRNIFLSSVSRSLSSSNIVWLTDYGADSTVTVRTPRLVRLSAYRFLVLWEEYDSADAAVRTKLALVDENGALVDDIATANIRLSDCQPILCSDGLVRWYVTAGLATLYAVDPYALGELSIDDDLLDFGQCGDGLWWTLDRDGVLTIGGQGAMTSNPWNSKHDSIRRVVLEDGVTSVAAWAFYNDSGIISFQCGTGLTEIGQAAFYGSGVQYVYYSGSETQKNKIDIGSYNTALQNAVWLYNGRRLRIDAQPADARAALGSTASFTVTAVGEDLTYQWQTNQSGSWKNCTLAGNKTAALAVEATEARSGVKYRCVVKTNGDKMTSSAAKLILETAITAQPADVTASLNESGTFTIQAVGTGLTYQWQEYKNGAWSDTALSGSGTASLTVTATAENAGTKYRCVAAGEGGTVTSGEAVLLVKTEITAQPESVTAALDATAKFNVAAVGTNLTYQWQTNQSGSWKNCTLTGNKTATLSVKATAARAGVKYRCVVTGGAGTVTSAEAALILKTAVTAQPESVTAALDATAKFTVAAVGTNLTYQWQTNQSGSWKNCTLTGNKTAELSVTATTARAGVKYRCVVTGDAGKMTSSAAALILETAVTVQPESVTLATHEAAAFTVEAVGTNLIYQWQYVAPGGAWQSCEEATAKTPALQLSDASDWNGYKFRCRVDGDGGTAYSAVVKLIVRTNITAQPAAVKTAYGETASFSVAAEGTNLLYQWQAIEPRGAWKSIIDDSIPSAKTPTLTVPANEDWSGYKFRCRVVGDGGAVFTSVAKLTITTQLTAQPAAVTTAYGNTVSFTVSAVGTNLQYQWQAIAPGGAWKSIIDDAIPSAKTATLTIPANEDWSGYKFRCRVAGDGGAVFTNVVKLTITTKLTAQPANVTAKSGETAVFTVSAVGTNLTYRWEFIAPGSTAWQTCGESTARTAALQVSAAAAKNGYKYRCRVAGDGGSVYTSVVKLTVK